MLCAKQIYKSYRVGPSRLEVLKGASVEVQSGEFLVIMGASGSGKSTLLHVLGALDAPDRGDVEFRGQSLQAMTPAHRRAYRNRDVGFVFQFYHLLSECNVLENIMMPSLVGTSFWSWRTAKREARRKAEELLERVGLKERWKHRPNQLSGGERQRVAIARALVHSPELLLADEPTGNLDSEIGGEILTLLTELNKAGQTLIMVTHDTSVASAADRCLHIRNGRVE